MSELRDRLLADDGVLLSECTIRAQRRSGPGGQHRNKVETGIFVTHVPTGITAGATERRDQDANRKVAIARLRVRIAVTLREPPKGPSLLWRSRCQHRRITVSHHHADYARLLAEALDHLAAVDWQLPRAARSLECSTSSLVRLIHRSSLAWQFANQQRTEHGMPALK